MECDISSSILNSKLNQWDEVMSWWCHQMEAFSALLALCAGNSPVIGEFSSQRPVTRSFEGFFDLRLNKRLSKQSRRRWFETPSPSLWRHSNHYNDVIMGAIASQITSLTIVYSTVYSDADQRKHQSSASLAFVRGIHRGPVNSPHKWPVTRKMFPFDDVFMIHRLSSCWGLDVIRWKRILFLFNQGLFFQRLAKIEINVFRNMVWYG